MGVRLTGVSRVFGDTQIALSSIDLTIEPGAFTVIVGPSGCGKSTLLRLIGGLDQPSRGQIQVFHGDSRTDVVDAKIGYCFQEPRLLPWRSALSNVALPLELQGQPAEVCRIAAKNALDRVGLSGAYSLRPHEMSGGMQMRASIARALMTEPNLLLLDEPFSALDEMSRAQLDDELLALWQSLDVTVVMVTHSLSEAVYVGQTVYVMSDSPGELIGHIDVKLPVRDRSVRSSTQFIEYLTTAQQLLWSRDAGGQE